MLDFVLFAVSALLGLLILMIVYLLSKGKVLLIIMNYCLQQYSQVIRVCCQVLCILLKLRSSPIGTDNLQINSELQCIFLIIIIIGYYLSHNVFGVTAIYGGGSTKIYICIFNCG